MTLRYSLVGEGIAASPSPAMQTAAFRAAGIDAAYELCDIAAGALPDVMAQLRSGAISGCNVTIPHKASVARLCDRLAGDAAVLRVVNTVAVDGGELVGHNTDASGFERALRAEGMWPAPGSAAVVLGSGGAAAAVALALTRVPVTALTVVARNADAARDLLSRAAPAANASAVDWSRDGAGSALADADIVVNATPAGLQDLPLDVRRLRRSCTVADVRYRPRPVDLVQAAAASGRPACDGVAMLLHQGMLSFQIWTGREPTWDAARAALLEAIAG